MDNISKKAGYLKGLMEGMDFDAESENGKLLAGIIDLLSDLVERVEVVDEVLDDLNDYVESIDDALTALENGEDGDGLDFDDEDDEYEDFDDFDDAEDRLHLFAPEVSDEPNAELMEAPLSAGLCSECNRLFFIPLDDPDDAQYICPHCRKPTRAIPLSPENAPIAKRME